MAGLRIPSPRGFVVSGGERGCSRFPEPAPASMTIGGECLKVAEMATRNVLLEIWPALVADKKRNEIIEYLKSLIRYHTCCEVFSYGSVPLKTYLSDGDIDLTIIHPDIPDAMLASDVYTILLSVSSNVASRFRVTDVQYIDAEVKLVKCIVDGIVVDISSNQLGGLSALCFLEQIDRIIGKDHLFKRSVILIKAWCYYESRILGSHHGLISTYALEILVLHIFDLFYCSLQGPLSVLHKFLVYFSSFDWDNYCVSLKGLIRIYNQQIVVGNSRLLSEEFLNSCREKYGVSSNGVEIKSQPFSFKHLNIIDPLKENNNLGRSVNKGSFWRIRSAFKHGANKLSSVLSLPVERITNEIHAFFSNTLRMNKRNYRNTVSCIVDMPIDTPITSYLSSGSYDETAGDYSTMLSDMMLRFAAINENEMPKRSESEEVAHSGANPTKTAFVDSVDNLENRISIGAVPVASLLDLNGDYEGNFRNLRFGQLCHVYAKAPTWHPVYLPPQQPFISVPWRPPVPPFPLAFDPQRRPQNSYYYSPRSRGTGTYIPDSQNYQLQSYWRSHGRRRMMDLRNSGQFRMPRQFHRESWNVAPHEIFAPPLVEWGYEVSPPSELAYDWSSGSSDVYQPINYSSSVDSSFQSENLTNTSSCSSSTSPNEDINNSPVVPLPELGAGALLSHHNPCASVSGGRVDDEVYRLKDECDFPPLTA